MTYDEARKDFLDRLIQSMSWDQIRVLGHYLMTAESANSIDVISELHGAVESERRERNKLHNPSPRKRILGSSIRPTEEQLQLVAYLSFGVPYP